MLTLNDGRAELWQWDTGRTLAVDADCSQVHFSNKVFGRSIDVDVTDGVAIIPDILLQTDKDLNVWAFVGTAENGYTKISKTFKVNRRNKPADYVFTPADQTTLEQIQEKIDYLESIQDPDAIKNAVNDYLDQNPVESPVHSVNGRTGEVELTSEDVGAISKDDLQEATNEALAQAKASGEFDGAPGADGHTPEYGVDYGTPQQISGIAQSAAEILQPEINQIKDDIGDFRYAGQFSAGSKYSKKDISTVPQKGDLIFFVASECSSQFFVNASLFLYYTENDYDLISIQNIGDYKIFVSQKNYIKATVGYALSQIDESVPTWKATVMNSRERNLSGILMQFYDLLDNGVKLRKTDIENLKNDLISKYSGRFNVSKSNKNTYLNFPVKTGDKGFIFVSDTNASKFTAYDLYGHKTDDTFEVIAGNITTIGNIYTYENSKGYDYYRIIFKCSAPSTADEYVSVVFTTDTEMTAYGIITRIFNDVDVLKSTSATQEQIADLDARMLKTEENVLFQRNILNVNNLVDGKFISSNGELGTNANYSVTDYEFVEPNASYTWYRYNGTQRPFGQYAFYSKNKKFISYGAGGNVLVVPSNAYYVRISDKTSAMTTQNPIICKGLVYSSDSVYQNEYKTVVKHYVTREEIAKINIPDVAEADTLSTLTIVASNSKKNNIIGFEANFTTMGSVRIAHGTSYDSNRSASIVVDATNIYLYDKSTNLRATYPHGLTMDKFITVSIIVGQTKNAKVILTTSTGRFIQDNVFWGGCREDVTAQAVSGTFTNARLTWYVPDYNYDLWAFGDSYFDFWVADIIQNLGYHNFMSDGFGGRGSTGAFNSLKLALEKATPKKILWCLGMNDPDTEDAINATWKNVADNLIELCDEKGIELILCTIPITPVTEHKYKNAYVKASGKRYVDVCHAVGADISAEWYDGMRTNTETDKIHPTSQLGTRTISDYMIANVPELCIN